MLKKAGRPKTRTENKLLLCKTPPSKRNAGFKIYGEGGIRTLEALRLTGFRDLLFRPLTHLSKSLYIITNCGVLLPKGPVWALPCTAGARGQRLCVGCSIGRKPKIPARVFPASQTPHVRPRGRHKPAFRAGPGAPAPRSFARGQFRPLCCRPPAAGGQYGRF